MDPRHSALVSEIERLSGAIQSHRARGRARVRARPYRNRSLAVSRDAWVHRRSAGSVSLVNPAVFHERARSSAARAPTRGAPRARAGARRGRDASVRRGDRMGEVLVDGVTFVFDESGTKLVKKSVAGAPEATPLHTSVNGHAYVRTKRGNLIARELVAQRRAARAALCAFYTRSGTCRRGARCPYIHDPARVALCPGALKPSGCVNARCQMSHTRSAHNAPHCVHFLRSGTCRNGDACPYTHTPLAPDARVCSAFARLGWCDAGAACTSRHAFECPDYAAGECRDAACRLAHVRPEPTPDVLFVRDDSGADDRYFAMDVPESAPAPADADESGLDADFIAIESVTSGEEGSEGSEGEGEESEGEGEGEESEGQGEGRDQEDQEPTHAPSHPYAPSTPHAPPTPSPTSDDEVDQALQSW